MSPSRAAAGARADRHESARRTEILRAAAVLFASSGYVHTSLRDVADACGIQAGSLYHHFDSKEAIARELIAAWHDELERIGEAWLTAPPLPTDAPAADRISAIATDVATAAVRHKAALHLSAYEPHAGASPELVELAHGRPVTTLLAMRSVLDDARDRGAIEPGVDVAVFAEQLHETMLHVGLATLHRTRSGRATAATICRMLLHGIASRAPGDAALDASEAMSAATAATRAWSDAGGAHDPRMRLLLEAARKEFARRGFEGTAVRDVAAAAGIATGSVYKLVDSKDALVALIMNEYHERLSLGYAAVATTDSTAVEQLDALTWFNIRALERFAEEFEIQRSWYRSSPPRASSMSRAMRARLAAIAGVVSAGEQDGDLRLGAESQATLVQCIRDLIWLPPQAQACTTPRGALAHVRGTLLRGALTPSHR